MEFKNLSKASNLFDQIKNIDIEIVKIEKFAMLLVNKETKSEITIKVEEVNKTEGRGSVLDSDGSLVNGPDQSFGDTLQMHRDMLNGRLGPFSWSTVVPALQDTITQSLSDTLTLELLGLLLGEKKRQRKQIIMELNKMGIK